MYQKITAHLLTQIHRFVAHNHHRQVFWIGNKIQNILGLEEKKQDYHPVFL